MSLAALRNRLSLILDSFGTSRARGEPEPPAPEIAAMVYQLALIAVGDTDSATTLTADTLIRLGRRPPADGMSSEVAAVRALREQLPTGWLSWPTSAGPSEYLKLGLRREQADRLLSVLGEREAAERIALALHLLYDVRREDLDTWLKTQGMGERIAELASGIGAGLELLAPPSERAECIAVAGDLVEIDEPQLGRRARLHVAGCDECRARSRGLKNVLALLRAALPAFFRAQLPVNFDARLRARRQQLSRLPISWRPLAAVGAALLLLILARGAVRGEPAASRYTLPPPRSAAELIDRAIYRLDVERPSGEVWHEQVSFANNGERLLLERWYEFSRFARMHIVVRPENGGEPLLDLVSTGRSVGYQVRSPGSAPRSVVVRNVDTKTLLPLLRQLPFAGNLGDRMVDQRSLDLTLLAAGRSGSPRLLGSTLHNGRQAWMVVVETPDDGDMTLTIDSETSSLLEARVDDGGSSGRTRSVWEVQEFGVLPRDQVPASTFRLPKGTTAATFNPRQLSYLTPAVMGMDAAETLAVLPLPADPLEAPLLSYIRAKGRNVAGVVAVYEGRWNTIQVVYPLDTTGASSRPPTPRQLDRVFAGGRYALIEHSSPNVTLVELAFDGAWQTRIGLYYWSAFDDPSAREAAVQQLLDSLRVGTDSVAWPTRHFANQAHPQPATYVPPGPDNR